MTNTPPTWPAPAPAPKKSALSKVLFGIAGAAFLIAAVVVGVVIAVQGNGGPSVALTMRGNTWITIGLPKGWKIGSAAEDSSILGPGGRYSLLAASKGDPAQQFETFSTGNLWVMSTVIPSSIDGPTALSVAVNSSLTPLLAFGIIPNIYSSNLPTMTKVTVNGSKLKEYTDTFEVDMPATAPVPDEKFSEIVYTNGKTLWLVIVAGKKSVFNKDQAEVSAIIDSVKPQVP